MKRFIQCFLLFLLATVCTNAALAQTCTTLGQTPETAFPVCGTNVFSQTIVPNCGGKIIPGPCTGIQQGVQLQDLNPFWYKFTCFQSGTLGFLIEPDDQGDDYDWQLFDITGHNPEDVYSDRSLFVACNWSGRTGNTGASSSGSGSENCAGTGYPTFNIMPAVIQDHQYILLLSHFNTLVPGQAGYKLSFQGGSASITDPTLPGFLHATAACDGSTIRLKLSKKIKCTSIDFNGSDFEIQGLPAKVISATGIGCSSGFDVDSIILTLDKSLVPGDYKVVAKQGDKDLLLDNCDNSIDPGTTADVTVFPVTPTPFNTLLPVACAPDFVDVIFERGIQCGSVAANGSDFSITGSYPVGVTSAEGILCSGELTNVIRVHLAAKLQTAGTFNVNLKTGSDGTTIIDECGSETHPAFVAFSVMDTVSADFTYNITENCTNDFIELHNAGNINVNNWDWTIDNIKSNLQAPSHTFDTYGIKTVQLAVTNGFCTDTIKRDIIFPHDTLTAAFNGPTLYCPNDLAVFKDTSRGNVISWQWEFGNGHISTLQIPPSQTYYTNLQEELFHISLIVKNTKGCFDTTTGTIKAARSCYIAVPSGFTPNGDGNNDFLYPLYAYKATDLLFSVYNRMGQRVYETRDWTKKWDGTLNGNPQPTGVYVWMLRYKDEFGKPVFLKGTTVLLR